MKQALVLAFATTSALLALACGGGGGGSVRYAETVVPIKHLDLDGVELAEQDFLHPSFANRYPSVVAEVNGQPVAGEALVRMQMTLEFQRRGAVQGQLGLALVHPSNEEALQERTNARLQAIESTDPLEAAIDEVLKRQAIQRLQLLGSREDAVAQARTAEASLRNATPALLEQTLESYRAQGIPTENWASDSRVVEAYRWSTGLANLGRVCRRYATPQAAVPDDCSAFLAREREHADIVYYVRWAD